jgi:hypothetical protein
VNAHLNYVTATGIDVWNDDPEHVIDVIPDFTKPDIEDQWNQARQLEDAMVAEIFDSSVCACCGHRFPHSDMQIGLTDTTYPNILEILISCETEKIKRPSRIRLSTSLNDYVIHDSYIGKSVFDICNLCHKSLSKAEPKLPEMCLKTYDIGPWPSILFENDVSLTLFKRPTFAERIVMSPLMHTKYLTTGYHVSGEKYTPEGQLSGHITAFPKPLPATIKEALEEHFPLSISQLESIIQIVLITATSDEEAREKAKSIEGMQISAFWLDLWCKHLVEVWRDSNIEDLTVSMNFYLLY